MRFLQSVTGKTWPLALVLAAVSSTSSLRAVGFHPDGDLDENSATQEDSRQQQGSWAHWWSYDGISGPDYWNINKRWRLCGLGRKQSPVEIRTDRLVYDHLLGNLQFAWLPASAISLNEAQKLSHDEDAQKAIKVQLLNSGRGVEAWLESATLSAALPITDQLILAKGPLSYAYKCFKLELHTAASGSGLSSISPQAREASRPEATAPAEEDVDDVGVAEIDVRSDMQQSIGRSSEHLIDGRAFDGELQMHFYNKHLASSAAEALRLAGDEDTRSSLFAVVSIFVKTNPGPPSKSSLDFVLDNLAAIPNAANSIELQLTRRHIDALITTSSEYVTYQGSLNRPPCSEVVDWILLNKPIRVDRAKFQLLFEKLNTNQDNVRPARPLNRRLLRTTISSNLRIISTPEHTVQREKFHCASNKVSHP